MRRRGTEIPNVPESVAPVKRIEAQAAMTPIADHGDEEPHTPAPRSADQGGGIQLAVEG
jgi:hypothetical protein